MAIKVSSHNTRPAGYGIAAINW